MNANHLITIHDDHFASFIKGRLADVELRWLGLVADRDEARAELRGVPGAGVITEASDGTLAVWRLLPARCNCTK